ncbi:MAG: phage holin family protein [Deltaproteobacteria bacterium]|nr:phage holin family protein [Deltaproteobacteria bacterium]
MEQNNTYKRSGEKLFIVAIKWLFLTAALVLVAQWVDGIHVGDFNSALLAAGVLGLLNIFARPALLLLTLPLNILSVGLFTFIINAALLKLASFIVPSFSVDGFVPAIIGALLISIINWFLNLFLGSGSFVIIRGGHR